MSGQKYRHFDDGDHLVVSFHGDAVSFGSPIDVSGGEGGEVEGGEVPSSHLSSNKTTAGDQTVDILVTLIKLSVFTRATLC